MGPWIARGVWALLLASGGCSDADDDDDHGPGIDAGAARDGSAGDDGGDGEPDADVPACADPAPPAVLSLATGGDGAIATTDDFVVLTGRLPAEVEGSPVVAVQIDGSDRGVRWDADRGLWTYLLARPAGEVADLEVRVQAASGASAATTAHVTVGPADPTRQRDVGPDEHTVGTWMFTWFTGDPSWECGSPWRPVDGFAAWDGSVAWARGQLLDQMDARIDLVGLQLDTIASGGPSGYRFDNPMRVLDAARALLDEGYAPPRLFPFVDTAILAELWRNQTNETLDLSTAAGRDHLYDFFRIPWEQLATRLGPRAAFGGARTEGRPMIAMWHSVTIDGEDGAVLRDLKARFAADFGDEPYLIAHPNDWRLYEEIDEVTLMFGPPQHFWADGRDPAGRPTINIEAGFWNPISNDFYLPREGGGHFDDAWAQAQGQRDGAVRLWIDSWNETGEGSGIFAAEPVTYGVDDRGPCGQFVNVHDESWGPTARHYVETVRDNAAGWTRRPDWDAELVAHDLPRTLRAGERRWATVVLRTAGAATWPFAAGPRLADRGSDGFGVLGRSGALTDRALAAALAGVPRGAPAAFPVLLTGPCTPGTHTLRLGLVDAAARELGPNVTVEVTVSP